MKKLKIVIAVLMFQHLVNMSFAQLSVSHLLIENFNNPCGIVEKQPRFSWQLNSETRGQYQTAYEIKVFNENGIEWSSGKVNSDQTVLIPYTGSILKSCTKYFWKVRVWDKNNKLSKWSETNRFQMGLLSNSEWQAKWIMPGYEENPKRESPLFRKQFFTSKKIKNALAFVTSHGLYEAQINGKRVGDAYLTPGWTSYNNRLEYQSYDVTDLIQTGNNVIGVTLGNGWYRGTIGYMNKANFYGSDIALLFQMNITYSDGTKDIVISDGNWKSTTGAIIFSEIYNGETIDARKEKKGWSLPDYNDSGWSSVKVINYSLVNLVGTENELIKKHEIFKPVKLITTPKGESVIDFGQNLVGWVVMKVKGAKGDTIILSHAEMLDKQGNFYTENLRQARAQDTYILNGDSTIFEPHFTWHGFRYLKIEGYPGKINVNDFTAVALYSDLKQTGTFISSNALVNQLQKNILWGQKGNFLDIPTDCPQRDERLGWTGDAQVFSRTAAFNLDVNNFFSKWIKDLKADQQEGVVPFVIPNILGAATNSAGWADAATIIPWNIYLVYGDKRILEEQYSSMKSYVESIHRYAKNDLWNFGFHFGDWLFYRPEDDNDGLAAVTDKYLIAQCFYAHSTHLLIKVAQVLNKTDDVIYYSKLLERIKNAFVHEYLTPNGRLISGTQTAYVLALNFDMIPDSLRVQAAKRLADNIQFYGNHLTTGFLGTPYICEVLTRFGYLDLAYKLLLQDTYPSWLYPVKMGATTIWERWDGQKPDSTFQTPGMNSFNHYAYGAIGDWMYRQMAGLDTYEDGAGYKHIKIKPQIGGDFSYVSASLLTRYGKVSSKWELSSGKISMDIEIPVNTTATIFVPSLSADSIIESGKLLTEVKEIRKCGEENGYIILNVGSGKYHFIANEK